MTKTMTFTFHADPGHGWLEVPFQMLQLLGIEEEITPYSYRRGSTCYLEEDQDAGTFIKAVQNHGFGPLDFHERNTTEDSFVRMLPRYTPTQ